MIVTTKYLALVVCSMTLVACGGGGGGGDVGSRDIYVTAAEVFWPVVPDVSVASTALAKYEGEWRQACADHMQLKTVLVAASANEFTVTMREDYYDYADCTGSVVATGSYGKPSETVKYSEIPLNASVLLLDGSTRQADVDPAVSSISMASFALTGSGVKSTIYVDGKPMTPIQFADAYVLYPARALTGGTTQGALLLLDGKLLTLVAVPDDATSFNVKLQFFR